MASLILKGRGVDLNDRLREHAAAKLEAIDRFFERIIRIQVELSEERNPRVKLRHRCEVVVKVPRETLRAHGAGADYFAAIDQAADRLERQVKKVKDRVVDRHHRGASRPTSRAGPGQTGTNHLESPTRAGDEGRAVILRTTQPLVKPMTPEEAVVELQEQGADVLLFTSAVTRRMGAVYRRDDGVYSVVETEG